MIASTSPVQEEKPTYNLTVQPFEGEISTTSTSQESHSGEASTTTTVSADGTTTTTTRIVQQVIIYEEVYEFEYVPLCPIHIVNVHWGLADVTDAAR
mmetsp:Transcript_38590/g.28473  ORF Transcript_38590/g.28473 Transcript_38590/m.28473 type:complete len:97 (+) Transcript_38590:442-732(+)